MKSPFMQFALDKFAGTLDLETFGGEESLLYVIISEEFIHLEKI